MRRGAIRCGAMRCAPVWRGAARHGTMRCEAMRRDAAETRQDAIRGGATREDVVRHDSTRRGLTRRSAMGRDSTRRGLLWANQKTGDGSIFFFRRLGKRDANPPCPRRRRASLGPFPCLLPSPQLAPRSSRHVPVRPEPVHNESNSGKEIPRLDPPGPRMRQLRNYGKPLRGGQLWGEQS